MPSSTDSMPQGRPAQPDAVAPEFAALHAVSVALRDDVAAWIAEESSGSEGVASAQGSAQHQRFDALAQRLFALQREGIAAYRGYVAAKGIGRVIGQPDASGAAAWPLLPVSAYKRYPVQLPWVIANPAHRFETSGTSDGAPGVVRLADVSLYDHAALATFVAHVVPEALRAPQTRWRVLCLLPSPALRPHSSLGHMATMLADRLGDGSGGWLVTGEQDRDVVDVSALMRHAEQCAVIGRPALVLATTLATGLLMESWPQDRRLPLPPGSRWMDTGGAKGRTLRFDRAATHAWICETFGMQERDIVGELGMTELGSQRYEPLQRAALGTDAVAGVAAADWRQWRGHYVGPPWLRSVVLDPQTLAPLSDGAVGLIGHIDLANIETNAFVLTADLGSMRQTPWGPALQLAGRLPGAEWRGCGLAVEDVATALAAGAEALANKAAR